MAQAMLDQANFSKSEQNGQEQKDMETLLSTFTESIGVQQVSANFSQDDKVVPKKKDEAKK